MEERNKYVSNISKEAAIENNEKYYYKRIGRCHHKKCQSACCRFRHVGKIKASSKRIDYKHEYESNWGEAGIQIKHSNGYEHKLKPFLCPSITFDGKCKLHNKKEQPRICKYFPMSPEDGVYIALQHICGITFKKIRNNKYKKRKEKKDGK